MLRQVLGSAAVFCSGYFGSGAFRESDWTEVAAWGVVAIAALAFYLPRVLATQRNWNMSR